MSITDTEIFTKKYGTIRLGAKFIKHFLLSLKKPIKGEHEELIEIILNKNLQYYSFEKIENLRNNLLENNSKIHIVDYGAGSRMLKKNQEKKISDIVRTAVSPAKYAQLLFRLINFFQPNNIIEIGTSLGISSMYMALANKKTELYTLEGSESLCALAQKNFDALNISNIKIYQGEFENKLPEVLSKLNKVHFVFIDGNHRYRPTMDYFESCLKKSHVKTVFVFDDIHWSCEMEKAWRAIQNHRKVTLTIDLFFKGIVLIDPKFDEKHLILTL